VILTKDAYFCLFRLWIFQPAVRVRDSIPSHSIHDIAATSWRIIEASHCPGQGDSEGQKEDGNCSKGEVQQKSKKGNWGLLRIRKFGMTLSTIEVNSLNIFLICYAMRMPSGAIVWKIEF
jgi:hypothetical protein